PVFLHVHTHVREDALVLYGFPTRDERACFEALVSAHGVGPALALAILGALSPAALQRAVISDDADAFCAVPGVGRKTAARLLMEAARRRQQPADHVLLAGPPGLGKTTMAGIVAAEMGVGFRVTSGPALVRTGDLAAILTDLHEGDVLFIDEIHRLGRAVEEI